MPDVSVIIAAWNAEAHIGQALACALGQTGVSLEVVVADDASTDATGRLVQALGDTRIVYQRMPVNGGPAAARNAAMQAACGDWLLVLDADDRMEPDRAATLLAAARETKADIVADNFWIESQDGSIAPRLHIEESLDGGFETIDLTGYARANRLFGRGPALGYLKPMFRAEFLRAHGLSYPDMRIGEDYALIAQALARGARYIRRRTAQYTYVTSAGSISHRLSADNLAAMTRFDREFLKTRGGALSTAEAQAIGDHLKSLENGEAFTAMVDAIKARRPQALLAAALRRPAAVALFRVPILDKLRGAWR